MAAKREHVEDVPVIHLDGDTDVGADITEMRRDLPSLEAVERRRAQLWTVAGILLLAASTAVLLLITEPGAAAEALPQSPALRWSFAGISIAFLLYVFDQERRLRRLSEALVKERVLSIALESRVKDLATLSRVGQVVNSVLTMEEVLGVILDGAFQLTDSVTGSVMLLDGDELVVEVSSGNSPAPVGARQPISSGVAGWVATRREPTLITGRLRPGQLPSLRERRREGASSVIAPLLLADELLGILTLERAAEAEPFTEWELRAVALFASHAATAVANARRYESERSTVERLADLLERRSEYVATLVHDLKAPLTAILGYLKLVRQRADRLGPEKQAEVLQRTETSAEQLLDMVEDILHNASAEAEVDIRRQPLDLNELCTELAEVTGSMAQARDGEPRSVHVEPSLEPPIVYTDPAAVRSVLVNLLENAVKYSPPGSAIDVDVQRHDTEVIVSVTDRGAGIAAQDVDRIFERFRQQDPATPSGGVGLGLYIVRSLVQALGGRVWVRSEVGEGSTFHVAFPIRAATEVIEPASVS
ncbi:MAG: ATP-binding protein [Nitriliruptorales bacterium]|nr:ATP-binding protein [Nitriliruptorales bacterium]